MNAHQGKNHYLRIWESVDCMFSFLKIHNTRDDLIKSLIKERYARMPILDGPMGPVNPKMMIGMIDQADPFILESSPEAAILWIVEQMLALASRKYSLETAMVIIANFRNETIELNGDRNFLTNAPATNIADFIHRRINAEFPLPQPMDVKYVEWALKQCTKYIERNGYNQKPIA